MSKNKKALKRMKKRALAEGSYSTPKFGEPNLVLDTCPQAWEDWAMQPWTTSPEGIEAKKRLAEIALTTRLPLPKRGRPRNVTPEHILEVVRAAVTYKPMLVTNPFIERFCIDNLGLITNLHKEGKL